MGLFKEALLKRALPLTIALICGFYYTFFLDNDKYGRASYPLLTFLTKGMPPFMFALYIILNSSLCENTKTYHKTLITAYIFAGLGDEALELDNIFSPNNRGLFYFIGGCLFFTAQIIFALSFSQRVNLKKLHPIHYVRALSVFTICVCIMAPYVKVKAYWIVIITYELGINAVGLFAFVKPSERFRNKSTLKNFLIPIGSALFIFSDMLVLTKDFMGYLTKFERTLVVMITYYLALFFFLMGGFCDKYYKSAKSSPENGNKKRSNKNKDSKKKI